MQMHNNRGYAKSKMKDYYRAISDYIKAIEINPNYALAFANRGSSKEQQEICKVLVLIGEKHLPWDMTLPNG